MSHFSELLSRGQDPLNVSVSVSHNCYLHEVSRVGYHHFDMAGEEIKADWVRRVSGLQDKARVKTKNNPLHCSRQSKCSCLEKPMDRGAWRATVHGVAENWT